MRNRGLPSSEFQLSSVHQRHRIFIAVAVVSLVGLIVRMKLAAEHPLWLDESIALMAFRLPLAWAEKYWIMEGAFAYPLLGSRIPIAWLPAELTLRIPSLVVMSMLPFVLMVAARRFGPLAQFSTALFGALGWFAVVLGSEAKGQSFLMVLGFLLQWRLLYGRGTTGSGKRLWTGCLFLFALPWCSVLILAPVSVAALLLFWDGSRRKTVALQLGFLCLVVFFFWVWIFWPAIQTAAALGRFHGPWRIHIGDALAWYFGLPTAWSIVAFVLLLGLAMVQRQSRAFVLIGITGVLAVLTGAYLFNFQFYPRYAAFALPWFWLAFGVLVGRGFKGNTSLRILVVALACVWLSSQIQAVHAYYGAPRKPFFSVSAEDLWQQLNAKTTLSSRRPVFVVELNVLHAYLFFTNLWAYHQQAPPADWILIETSPYHNLCYGGKTKLLRACPPGFLQEDVLFPASLWAHESLWATSGQRVTAVAPDDISAKNLAQLAGNRSIWWIRPNFDTRVSPILNGQVEPCLQPGISCWQGVLNLPEPWAAVDDFRNDLSGRTFDEGTSLQVSDLDFVAAPGVYAVRFVPTPSDQQLSFDVLVDIFEQRTRWHGQFSEWLEGRQGFK